MTSTLLLPLRHPYGGQSARANRRVRWCCSPTQWQCIMALLGVFFAFGLPSPAYFLATAPAHAIDLTYAYDDLGRLKLVVDPQSANEAALYTYDVVGNLTGIERRSAALLSLVEFSPKCGAGATTVTLYGTAFSPTASQNTVRFNGIATTATAATSTTLVATVPGGATSGPLAVTTPSGTTTSSQTFTVGVCP